MFVFWVGRHVVWQTFTDVSQVLAAPSETSVNFYQTTWRNNPDDSPLHVNLGIKPVLVQWNDVQIKRPEPRISILHLKAMQVFSRNNLVFQRIRTVWGKNDAETGHFPRPCSERGVQYDSAVRSEVSTGRTSPPTSCWPWNRFTRELWGLGERSSASRGPTDTKAALAVRRGGKPKAERQPDGSVPTACSSNHFPCGQTVAEFKFKTFAHIKCTWDNGQCPNIVFS
jgi:hypothetical protein